MNEERMEQELQRGHPEADGYAPPTFAAILARKERVRSQPARVWFGPLVAVAVIVLGVVGVANVVSPRLTPGAGSSVAASAASERPSPTTSVSTTDPIAEVQAALLASGITVVDAHETTSIKPDLFSCLSGSLQTFAFDQNSPHDTFQPGEKPRIDVVAFSSATDRQAAQRQISNDGRELNASHCGGLIEWVATPHWVGGGRYLLLVVSDDTAVVRQLTAAASRLGSP